MFIGILRTLVIIAGPLIGYFQISSDAKGILIGVGAALVVLAIEIIIQQVPLDSLIAGTLGGVIGLICAKLLDWVIYHMNNDALYVIAQKYSLLLKIVLAYLGVMIFVRKQSELELLDKDIILKGSAKKHQDIKILDTSALIDGRVADVCDTRFLSGMLVVPKFVLKELQAVADSSDTYKRAKGRRGMEILARMQEESKVPVRIFEKDYTDVPEVDGKLVLLAKDIKGKIVTTDFNLNKIASVQGIEVLNINDLANALRPVVLPGEAMTMFVAKEGKERDQGVGYLDDGTMVVIEDGRRFVGKRIDVTVASVLQTSAGRIIFTRTKDRDYRSEGQAISHEGQSQSQNSQRH